MTAQEYLTKRVQDQYNWYNKKSVWNQKHYKRYKLIVIILSVSIPFLAGLSSINEKYSMAINIVIGLMGIVIAAIEGIQNLYKYQDNWLEYRRTAESLYREQLLFEAKAGPYQDDQSVQVLVERCENIMSQENKKWQELQTQAEKKPEKKGAD